MATAYLYAEGCRTWLITVLAVAKVTTGGASCVLMGALYGACTGVATGVASGTLISGGIVVMHITKKICCINY